MSRPREMAPMAGNSKTNQSTERLPAYPPSRHPIPDSPQRVRCRRTRRKIGATRSPRGTETPALPPPLLKVPRRGHPRLLDLLAPIPQNAIRNLPDHLVEKQAQVAPPPIVARGNMLNPIGVRAELITLAKAA